MRLCFVTFVFGDKYQDYIPLLIYSLKKSYPEYHVMIFVHKKLKEDVRKQIEILKCLGSFEIKEDFLSNYEFDAPRGASVRWILWDKSFYNFETIYFVDIDIIYVKESPGIYEQHLNHMSLMKIPVSNVLRKFTRKSMLDILYIARIFKHKGFSGVYHFFIDKKVIKRATGLHFVLTKPYYESVLKIIDKYTELILDSDKFRKSRFATVGGDEELLYDILDKCGWAELMPQAESNDQMMSKCAENKYYRPHHGIHLGIFRSEKGIKSSKDILELEVYKEYSRKVQKYFSDPLYIEISRYFSNNIEEEIEKIRKYYGI
ncbi:MAG TPA: hypothetical protein PKG52_02030 [bacterium]|nr:hypothetical protein [bacterium]HPS29093.1 hypothetical protein [bacterium]